MQSEGRGGKFTGVWNCVSQTVSKEGVVGLYKGMAAPLVLTGTSSRAHARAVPLPPGCPRQPLFGLAICVGVFLYQYDLL